jgi:L-lysine 6-oxidase
MRISEKLRHVLRLVSGGMRRARSDGWNRRDFIAVSSVVVAAATSLGAQPRKEKGKGPVPPGRQRYVIHPAIGVARLGNSPDSFYLEPATIGGVPIECDAAGNPRSDAAGQPVYVKSFKEHGRIRRQAAQFGIFLEDSADPSGPGREITLDDPAVESIEWTVHLANKKSVWYENGEFIGNAMLATTQEHLNYYAQNDVHNKDVKNRQSLIIDPGPRSISTPGASVAVSASNTPSDYPHASFPDPRVKRAPYSINSLGEIKMNAKGGLLVLGGHGRAGGTEPAVTYTGADTWFDDISDGPVYCTLKLKGRAEPIKLTAWALVGSPKFAPELRNITNLDDVMLDVAVQFQNLVPAMHDGSGFRKTYQANYERDIEPIFDRIADYIWVANVPSMVAFSAPKFNTRDASPANRANRMKFFAYFRDSSGNEISDPHNELLHNGVPLVPLNAGSNPVTNQNIDRWVGLTNTQYFLLGQWAEGKFTSGEADPYPVSPRDTATVGNCVGHPMSPGIEVSWSLRNPVVYESPYRIKHAQGESYYREHGLSAAGDETWRWYERQNLTPPPYLVKQDGCEPGDLTKRMSTPWMADFYQCAIQYISFRDHAPLVNQNEFNLIPPAPTYYANWWPPQAPAYVITGEMTKKEQAAAGVPAGYSVYYGRGANNISNLVIAWSYMGFILNENDSKDPKEGRDYPYFVEKERNHERFVAAAVSVANPVNQIAASGSYNSPSNFYVPTWYLREENEIAECDGIPDCDLKP